MNIKKIFLFLPIFLSTKIILNQENQKKQFDLVVNNPSFVNYIGKSNFYIEGETSLTATYTITKPGRYLLASDINSDIGAGSDCILYINSNDVSVNLNKKTIKQNNETESIDGILINNGMQNIIITNGTIANTTGNGIAIGNNSSNIHLKNIKIINCDQSGITIAGTSDNKTLNCSIKNCSVTGCTGGASIDAIGLNLSYCNSLKVENSHFNNQTTSTDTLNAVGVYANNCHDCSFINTIASGNEGETIGAGFYVLNSTCFNFEHCRAESNSSTDSSLSEAYGFRIKSSNYCTFKNCIGNYNHAKLYAYGFAIETSSNNDLLNCIGNNNKIIGLANQTYATGFSVFGANCNYNSFKNCYACRNIAAASSSSGNGNGFYIANASHCTIEDCTADYNGQTAGYAHGIILKSTCENTMVRNCKASNNSTTGVSGLPFNSTGYLNIENNTDSHSFYSVAVQPDYKIVIVGFTDASPFDGLVARLNTDGSFDTTFNTTGYINSEGDTNSYVYNHVVLQDDGKIIVVGFTDANDGIILRFNTDGSLDTTFNSTGYVNLENGTDSYIYKKVAIQSDGKYVVVGESDGNDGIVVRYNTDGSLDTTFNSTGYMITEDGTNSYLYDSVALQSDGKIVVVGRTDGSEGVIARYTTDGSLDPTFNTTGYFNAEGATGIDFNRLFGVAIQSDGKIVAVGRTDANDGLVARFNTDGTLDTTFNSTGYFNAENGTESYLFYSLTLDDDDKIIAVGHTNNDDALIVRLNTNGTLDTTFNTTGYINIENNIDSYFFNDVTIQDNGKIIGVGRTDGNDGFIVRYNPDGSLDTIPDLKASGVLDEHAKPSTNLIIDCFAFSNKDSINNYNYFGLYNYAANTADVDYDSLASLTIPTHKNLSINNR